MRPISIRDVHPKIGDVLQTTSDFVVVELVDDGPNPVCHARSLRGGQPTIVAPGSIRGIMIPVYQEHDDTPFRAVAPGPQAPAVEAPVAAPTPPTPPAAPPANKGYVIAGPGPQVRREPGPQPQKRHQHAPPPPPKTEEPKPDVTPSITQEVARDPNAPIPDA